MVQSKNKRVEILNQEIPSIFISLIRSFSRLLKLYVSEAKTKGVLIAWNFSIIEIRKQQTKT